MSEHKTAHVVGKPRIIYLTQAMQRLMKNLRRKAISDYVFINSRGKPPRTGRYRNQLPWQAQQPGCASQIGQTPSAQLSPMMPRFPLPWSHYVKLLAIQDPEARAFYETEALRGGWSVRQLDRQIASQFYQRTLLSRNKAAMLRKGAVPRPEDAVTPEEEIKDPLVLEFLGLKDEYSESELEEALIRHLETFLLELGGDFAFVGRQRRLRIGDEWYRIDLLFFHRRLAVFGGDRPQVGQVHPRRCRADAPVPELRPRTLDP